MLVEACLCLGSQAVRVYVGKVIRHASALTGMAVRLLVHGTSILVLLSLSLSLCLSLSLGLSLCLLGLSLSLCLCLCLSLGLGLLGLSRLGLGLSLGLSLCLSLGLGLSPSLDFLLTGLLVPLGSCLLAQSLLFSLLLLPGK